MVPRSDAGADPGTVVVLQSGAEASQSTAVSVTHGERGKERATDHIEHALPTHPTMMRPLWLDDLAEPTPPTHHLRLKRDALDHPARTKGRLAGLALLGATLSEERWRGTDAACLLTLEHGWWAGRHGSCWWRGGLGMGWESGGWERKRVRRTRRRWTILQGGHVERHLGSGRLGVERRQWRRWLVSERHRRLKFVWVGRDLLERRRVVLGEPWTGEDDFDVAPEEKEEEDRVDDEEGDCR